MKDQSRMIRALLGLLLALIVEVSQAECSVTDAAPRPTWADVTYVPQDGNFSASASAPAIQGSIEAAAAAARVQAVRQIAEQIQVRISSEVQLTEQATELDGEMKSSSSYSAAIRQNSELVLEGARTVSRWVDTSACAVWVLVELSAAQASVAQKRAIGTIGAETLRSLLVRAEDPEGSLAERDRSVRAAAALVDSINKDFPAEMGDVTVVRQNIRQTSARISEQLAVRSSRMETLRTARELLRINPDDRAARAKARKILTSAFESASLSKDAEDPVYEIGFELSGVLRADRDTCSASDVLSRIAAESPRDDIKERASRERHTLVCTEQSATASTLRTAIDGRVVTVYCPLSIRGDALQIWSRSCDELSRLAREAGGKPEIASLKSVQALLDRNGACAIACLTTLKDSGRIVMLAGAQGVIASRAVPDRADATDYQFKGVISLLVAARGDALVSEHFSGTTGWSPGSSDLALDVLALHSSKRLKARLAEVER